MIEVLIATGNRGKIAELVRLFEGIDAKWLGLRDFQLADVIEDRDTLEGNAVKKACEYAKASGLIALADDSGLEVDALDGAPGVHSARYSGTHGDDRANNARLLRDLERVVDRQARFSCALALADASGALVHVASGSVEGSIVHAPRGSNGFGYDPLFVRTGEAKTLGELSAAEKNARSHRAMAAAAMKPVLQSYLRSQDSR